MIRDANGRINDLFNDVAIIQNAMREEPEEAGGEQWGNSEESREWGYPSGWEEGTVDATNVDSGSEGDD